MTKWPRGGRSGQEEDGGKEKEKDRGWTVRGGTRAVLVAEANTRHEGVEAAWSGARPGAG